MRYLPAGDRLRCDEIDLTDGHAALLLQHSVGAVVRVVVLDDGDHRGADRAELTRLVDEIRAGLSAAHAARELALPACRRVIRAVG